MLIPMIIKRVMRVFKDVKLFFPFQSYSNNPGTISISGADGSDMVVDASSAAMLYEEYVAEDVDSELFDPLLAANELYNIAESAASATQKANDKNESNESDNNKGKTNRDDH